MEKVFQIIAAITTTLLVVVLAAWSLCGFVYPTDWTTTEKEYVAVIGAMASFIVSLCVLRMRLRL